MRTLLSAATAAALALVTLAPSATAAARTPDAAPGSDLGAGHEPARYDARPPARSGTVLNPANYTGPSNCYAAPDCAVWLQSRCDRRLAGTEPALFASIVDVRELAGSRRSIEAGGLFGRWLSSSHYEFWSADCRRLASVLVDGAAVVTIPPRAAWMTAPGQTGPYRWELR